MDFLNEFDPIEDEENYEKLKSPEYPKFKTNFHEKHWYRTVSKENQTPTAVTEINLLQVADHFQNCLFDDAIQILTELRENTKNNRTHEIMLIDSILQCWIRKEAKNENDEAKVLRFLSDYQSLIVDFGDQIQFLRTQCMALSSFLSNDFSRKFKEQMALLCELCGSIENWQIWEKCRFLTPRESYGVKLKIEKIILYEIEHSKGFVKVDLMRKMEKVREDEKKFEAMIGEEQAASVRSCFEKDHHKEKHTDAPTSSEFRAHESRSKNKLIPEADQPAVIHEFFRRFSFFEF